MMAKLGVFRMMMVERDDDEQLPPLVEAPPVAVVQSHSTHRSIETLVVVLAVITIVGVIAGIIARLCGGRHYGGSGDHEIEGWVERRCKSCIDGGLPQSASPPPPPAAAAAAAPAKEEAKPAKEEAKK